MIDEPPRCQNPSCGLPIAIISGHRRRQYCNNACRMAAHRARVIAENQARYEALQLQLTQFTTRLKKPRFNHIATLLKVG